LPVQLHFWDVMEDFFEFMFGAAGRINRAKYWVSLIRYSLAGLLVGPDPLLQAKRRS
jgi:uncharacterized membrane protein YhaH (DUF805 family)